MKLAFLVQLLFTCKKSFSVGVKNHVANTSSSGAESPRNWKERVSFAFKALCVQSENWIELQEQPKIKKKNSFLDNVRSRLYTLHSCVCLVRSPKSGSDFCLLLCHSGNYQETGSETIFFLKVRYFISVADKGLSNFASSLGKVENKYNSPALTLYFMKVKIFSTCSKYINRERTSCSFNSAFILEAVVSDTV